MTLNNYFIMYILKHLNRLKHCDTLVTLWTYLVCLKYDQRNNLEINWEKLSYTKKITVLSYLNMEESCRISKQSTGYIYYCEELWVLFGTCRS